MPHPGSCVAHISQRPSLFVHLRLPSHPHYTHRDDTDTNTNTNKNTNTDKYKYTNTQIHRLWITQRLHLFVHHHRPHHPHYPPLMIFPSTRRCCTSLCTILCTMHTWYKETANNCAHHCTPGVYRLEVIRNLWLHLRVASAVFPYHYRYTLYMYTLPLYIPYHYTFWNKYEVNQLPT